MSRLLAGLALGSLLLATPTTRADDPRPRLYQLRTYYTAPGKLPVLVDRFRAHNLAIFQRAGVQLEGAWVPTDPGEAGERLVYLVSFVDRDAADRAWKAFIEDPEWKQVFGAEQATHGTVVARAETVYLAPTDFSAAPVQGEPGPSGRLYELRTYIASEGKLPNLLARFREHTTALFAKHGMTNVLYTVPIEPDQGAGNTLAYLLSFPDRTGADASWQAFRDDPAWQKVYRESQADGVPLAAKVISVYLKPLDFSPLK